MELNSQLPSNWPPRRRASPLSRLGTLLARQRALRLVLAGSFVLLLSLAALDMLHFLWAKAVVHQAADAAARTAAGIGGNATTTERDSVVRAAQAALPGWIGMQTEPGQVQVTCSSPCMRHSPMTVSVEAQGRYWVPLGPLGTMRVSAHATRASAGDQSIRPTQVRVALAIATPQPTSPSRTPAPTATPQPSPTRQPEPAMTATARPTEPPTAPAPPRFISSPPTAPPPPPPPPTATPAPADLAVRGGGAQFDPATGLVVVTLLVTNDGESAADGVLVHTLVPAGFALVDSTMPFTHNGQAATWDLGNVAAHDTRLIIALLRAEETGVQHLTHHVSVTSQSPEQRTDNNQTSATVTW